MVSTKQAFLMKKSIIIILLSISLISCDTGTIKVGVIFPEPTITKSIDKSDKKLNKKSDSKETNNKPSNVDDTDYTNDKKNESGILEVIIK